MYRFLGDWAVHSWYECIRKSISEWLRMLRTILTGHSDLALRILSACATNWISKPEACEVAPAQPTKFIILQRLQREVGCIIIINGIIIIYGKSHGVWFTYTRMKESAQGSNNVRMTL